MGEVKLFNRWPVEGITVADPGLKNYIGLVPRIVPRTHGKHAKQQFHKSNLNIVERLMNKIFVPGHRGKKHLFTSGRCVGKTGAALNLVKQAFSTIEEKTKKNPVEVLVKAVENAALTEEITSFQVGGIMARKAVITSPQRRVDLALRLIVQGSYQKSHGKKPFSKTLAEEILAAYNHDAQNSLAIKERERIEREAQGAR